MSAEVHNSFGIECLPVVIQVLLYEVDVWLAARKQLKINLYFKIFVIVL